MSILIESLILFRAFRARVFARFPFFYVNVASTLVFSLFLTSIYYAYPNSYGKWYWRQQFVGIILRCGIIVEIFRHVLAPYPGTKKFASIVVFLIFGLVFCFVIGYTLMVPGHSLARTNIALERDLRTVQAVFLFGILAVISRYEIPMGRNMKGMILGYGMYLGISLVVLALRSHIGPSFNGAWSIIQPFSGDVSLAIWLIALWSYHPNPAPDSARLEDDYEALATRTRAVLDSLRSHLGKGVR